MGRPSVSIIITNFNYADFLPRSVGSALTQDYDGSVEVLVVDDKSTDNSADVIAAFGDRIRAVMKPENGGHGAAFNSGFAASSGDLVFFLDADDYLYPTAVSTVIASMQPDAAQYQYRLDLVDGAGVKLDIHPPAELRMEDGDVRPQLCTRGRFATTVTSGLAFPRWSLEKVMPMPPDDFRQGGDGFLVTVVPLYGRVVTVPGLLGAYCQHGGNHSQFTLAVAKRARWRLFHDEMRYKALRAPHRQARFKYLRTARHSRRGPSGRATGVLAIGPGFAPLSGRRGIEIGPTRDACPPAITTICQTSADYVGLVVVRKSCPAQGRWGSHHLETRGWFAARHHRQGGKNNPQAESAFSEADGYTRPIVPQTM